MITDYKEISVRETDIPRRIAFPVIVLKYRIILKIICFAAVMSLLLCINLPVFADDYETVYEYSFEGLKDAVEPRSLQVILKSVKEADRRQLVRGVLFTYYSRNAGDVSIAGSFSDWRRLPMERNKNGVWYYFLSEYERHDRIVYKFNVDGIWITDPSNDEVEDDNYGSYPSVAWPDSTPAGKFVTYRIVKKSRVSTVEFRIYDETADFISIAGDFNNWNPENDILTKGEDNIWRLTKKLPQGKYRYKFIINGEWRVDLYNPDTAADDTGGTASLIVIK